MTLALTITVPLAGTLLLVVVGSRVGRRLSAIVGAGALVIALASASAIAQAFAAGKSSLVAELGPWIPIRGADVALVVDSGTVSLLLATTAVGAVVGIGAAVALRRDASAVRTFIALDLLVASLLVLLTARDLILLFAGWQAVGVSAYLLLAHERHRPEAALAAARAFVLGRVADAALLVAVFAMLALFQTVDLEQIAGRLATTTLAPAASSGLLIASVLVVLAALTRAAQIPFHAWPLDRSHAAAVPLAAIHALVTMSGAFLLIRLAEVIQSSARLGAATVGVLIAVLAMIAALTSLGSSRELFRPIAQLGAVSRAGAILRATDALPERWIVPPFRFATTLFEHGGEQAIAAAADALVRATLRASAAVNTLQRAPVWVHEAILLVGASVIVIYWIVR